MSESYFEIKSEGYLVRLESIEWEHANAQNIWDRNWISTKVILKAVSFSGTYKAQFMASDFHHFKLQLISMVNNLKGSAAFKGLEDHLDLVLEGDGIGHIKVDVVGRDWPYNIGGCLSFEFEIDQTFLEPLIAQLELITKEFPPSI